MSDALIVLIAVAIGAPAGIAIAHFVVLPLLYMAEDLWYDILDRINDRRNR